MKKAFIFLFSMFFVLICFVGCTPKEDPIIFDGFRLDKYLYSESEEIEVEVSGYGDGYYLGIFNATSEPGKSNGYKKKSLKDDISIYTFDASDLRGSGEYQIFLYKKTINSVVQREVIKIWDNDKTDYVVQNAEFTSNIENNVTSSSIKITPSNLKESSKELTYRIYWANNNQRLEDYRYIKEVKSSEVSEFTINFNECMFMPSVASQIEVEVFEGSSSSYFIDVDDKLKLPESKYLFNFQVVSDIHLDGQYSFTQHTFHLSSAIKDFSSQTDPSKGVFFVGDLSNFGSDGNYKFLKETMDKYKEETSLNLYFAIGNHECQYYDEYIDAKTKFLNFVNRSSVYTSIEINGCLFILLGQEDTTTQGTMTQDQVDWFESELNKTDGTKPTFVFMHQPLSGTVNGAFSGQGNSGMGNVDSKLRAILKKHSNVFMFSGHSHRTPDLEKTTSYGKGLDATFINTGSLGYLLGLDDVEVGGSSGLFIEVYEDYVLVKAKNFVEGKWYASSQYIFPITE